MPERMTTEERNRLFTAAREQLKIALMFADGMAENPTASAGGISKFVNAVARANSAAIIFGNASNPPPLPIRGEVY